MNVSELKALCERIEKEIGPEALVRLQLRDAEGKLIEQDYCGNIFSFAKPYKVLVLTNAKPFDLPEDDNYKSHYPNEKKGDGNYV